MGSPYDPPETPVLSEAETRNLKKQRLPQYSLIALTLSFVVIAILWRVLERSSLSGSALLFIGLPACMSIALAFSPRPGSATGKIMKGMTFFLLLIGILLIEGVVCILMAAPILYAVGAIIGLLIDWAARKRKNNFKLNCSVLGTIFLLSIEGISESLSFPRAETVTVSQEVPFSLPETRAALARGPIFDLSRLPLFLKAGFPTPQQISGSGIQLGDQWEIQLSGMEGLDALAVEVSESTANQICFRVTKNDTKIGEWMQLHDISWNLKRAENGTLITMTTRYERLLDPAWYFKPLERYGMKKASEYFIESLFVEPTSQ